MLQLFTFHNRSGWLVKFNGPEDEKSDKEGLVIIIAQSIPLEPATLTPRFRKEAGRFVCQL